MSRVGLSFQSVGDLKKCAKHPPVSCGHCHGGATHQACPGAIGASGGLHRVRGARDVHSPPATRGEFLHLKNTYFRWRPGVICPLNQIGHQLMRRRLGAGHTWTMFVASHSYSLAPNWAPAVYAWTTPAVLCMLMATPRPMSGCASSAIKSSALQDFEKVPHWRCFAKCSAW